MAQPPNTDEIIERVSEIRITNNILWMQLLKLAVDSDHEKAREIIQQINKNDGEVTKWLGKL